MIKINFYISDLHLRHDNIIKFDNRPFGNTEEMENTIVKNWNNVVSKEDYVYIIGDFIWKCQANVWIEICNKLNGAKVLIRGNHDIKEFSQPLKKLFTDIKDYKEITDNSRHIIMCHYPILLYKGSYDPNTYMICGHVHTTRENTFLNEWRSQLIETKNEKRENNRGNIINVGCMMPYMDYTPRTIEELIEVVK